MNVNSQTNDENVGKNKETTENNVATKINIEIVCNHDSWLFVGRCPLIIVLTGF